MAAEAILDASQRPAPETRYGRVTVLGPSPRGPDRWECLCDCGRAITTTTIRLMDARTRSCGYCTAGARGRKRVKFPIARDPEAQIRLMHRSILARCYDPSRKDYPKYGGQGVTVVPEWQGQEGFEEFAKAVGSMPPPGCYLALVDASKPYGPSNVEWKEIPRMRRSTAAQRTLTYRGETRPIREFAAEAGLSTECLLRRLASGWPVEEALTSPPLQGHRPKTATPRANYNVKASTLPKHW